MNLARMLGAIAGEAVRAFVQCSGTSAMPP
jgi:hypothetical protein